MATPSMKESKPTRYGFTYRQQISKTRRRKAPQFQCWVSSTPPPSSWQPESFPPRWQSTLWSAWNVDGWNTLVLLAFCKWTTIEAGLQTMWRHGVMTTASKWISALDKHTPALASWSDDIEFYEEPLTSTSWIMWRSMVVATEKPWLQHFAMWSLRSTTSRTSRDFRQLNGQWDWIHEFLAFWWTQTSQLHSWILAWPWKRSWEISSEQLMQ